MIILYIPTPDLPADLGFTHDATDWQVATAPDFNDDSIVIESRSDTEHLINIVFDIDLDPSITYYARARVIHNKGIFEWSKIGILKVQDFIKVAFDYPIPSMVMKPTITLDFDPNNMPNSLFRITTTPISTTSNSEHESTTFIIEDISGRPIYTSLYNRDELTSILVDDIELESGKPYLIKVSHTSTSNDTSDFATQLIYVQDIKDILPKTSFIDASSKDGLPVSIEDIEYFKSLKVTIHTAGLDDAELIYEGETDTLTKIIPEDVFTSVDTYEFILGLQVTYENDTTTGIKYVPVKLIEK